MDITLSRMWKEFRESDSSDHVCRTGHVRGCAKALHRFNSYNRPLSRSAYLHPACVWARGRLFPPHTRPLAVVGPGSSWRGPQCACFGFQPNCHLQPWNSSSSFAVTTEFCVCALRVKVIFSFFSFEELCRSFFYFLICESSAYSLEENVRKHSTKKKRYLNSCNVNGAELKTGRGCSCDGIWKVVWSGPFVNGFSLDSECPL